jgi:biotin operon repressor
MINLLNTENPIRLVRELKGAPLSILMALTVVNQPVTQEWLERATGYTDKPISQALAYLEEIGLAVKSRAGWLLSDGSQQLPLPVRRLAEPEAAPERVESRNFSDSSLMNTTSTTSTDSDLHPVVVVLNPENRDFSDLEEPADGDTPEARKVALEVCGVAEPKRSKLAMMAGLNAVEIFALERTLKRKGEKYTPGLLIYALEAGQRAPDEDYYQAERDYKTRFCHGCKTWFEWTCPGCGRALAEY